MANKEKPPYRYNFTLRGTVCGKPIHHHQKKNREDSDKLETKKLDEIFSEKNVLKIKDPYPALAALRTPAVRKLNKKKSLFDDASAKLIRACNDVFKEKNGNVGLLVDGTGEPGELIDRLLGVKDRGVSDVPHSGYPTVAAVREGYTFGFRQLEKMYEERKLGTQPPAKENNERAAVSGQNGGAIQKSEKSKHSDSAADRGGGGAVSESAAAQRALMPVLADINHPDNNNPKKPPYKYEVPFRGMICGREVHHHKEQAEENSGPLRLGSGPLDENFLENLLKNKDPKFLTPPRLQAPNVKRLNNKRKKKVFDDASMQLISNFKKQYKEKYGDVALLLDTAKRKAELNKKAIQTQNNVTFEPPKIQKSSILNTSTTVDADFMLGFRKFQRLSDEKQKNSVLSLHKDGDKAILPTQSICNLQKYDIVKYSSPSAAYTGNSDSFFAFEPVQRAGGPLMRDSCLQALSPLSQEQPQLPPSVMMPYMDWTTEDEDLDRFMTLEMNYVPSDGDENCCRKSINEH